jgi:endonuclease/exonuclease/phosphatase family metal-dependent hydrolase
MKIVTWNMRFGGGEGTWRYLVDEIAPDLAFLQEARPPSKYADKSLIYQRIRMDNYRWGSAIYSPRLPLSDCLKTAKHEPSF